MATDTERIAFRLKHIIPRLTKVKPDSLTSSTPAPLKVDEPQELEFHMTWGKVAGKPLYTLSLFFLINSINKLFFSNSQGLGTAGWPPCFSNARLAG